VSYPADALPSPYMCAARSIHPPQSAEPAGAPSVFLTGSHHQDAASTPVSLTLYRHHVTSLRHWPSHLARRTRGSTGKLAELMCSPSDRRCLDAVCTAPRAPCAPPLPGRAPVPASARGPEPLMGQPGRVGLAG
jgi:hypothetical protein